jgi:hypothetical protein
MLPSDHEPAPQPAQGQPLSGHTPATAAQGHPHPDLEETADPALFGWLVTRRPRRAVLSAANIAVTVTGIVAVIAFHADVDSKLSTASASGLTAGGLSDPVINRDKQMLAVITIMLVALAMLNARFTTWATGSTRADQR